MRILLTADWHFGIRADSNIYHEIFKNWLLNFLIPNLEDINELSILGDLMDDRNSINVNTENLSLWAFDTIIEKYPNLKIKILCGNHDLYYKNTRETNSLKKFKKFKNIEIIDTIQLRMAGHREIIYCPWLTDKKELPEFIKKYGKADILFGHFDIIGFQMSRGIIEKVGWSQEFFKDNFGLVFSGHFHLRDKQSNIQYTGNPFQMDWGDFQNDKGIYILDTETLQVQFIENTLSPTYKKIYLSQLKNKTIDFSVIPGNFIQLILDTTFSDKMLEKLTAVVNSKNPLSFRLEGDKSEAKLDIEDIQESVSNPLEYLTQYCNELELPKEIDKDILINEVVELHNKCLV